MKTYKGYLRYKNEWCYLEVDLNFLNNFSHLTDFKWTKNPHISVVKDELLLCKKDLWGADDGKEIIFEYDDNIYNNGLHNWIICKSDELCKVRELFGAPVLKDSENGEYRVNFHLTIGKFKELKVSIPEKQFRLSARTHIDPKTMIQFV